MSSHHAQVEAPNFVAAVDLQDRLSRFGAWMASEDGDAVDVHWQLRAVEMKVGHGVYRLRTSRRRDRDGLEPPDVLTG